MGEKSDRGHARMHGEHDPREGRVRGQKDTDHDGYTPGEAADKYAYSAGKSSWPGGDGTNERTSDC